MCTLQPTLQHTTEEVVALLTPTKSLPRALLGEEPLAILGVRVDGIADLEGRVVVGSGQAAASVFQRRVVLLG